MLDKAGLAERMKAAGVSATDLVARAVYWVLLLVVLLLASQTVEIEHRTRVWQVGGFGGRSLVC